MAELIMLDGQTLTGPDRLGAWKTNTLEGWWDSPDPKGEEADRPGADGEYDLEVFYKTRYVTITGRLLTKGHADLHTAMNRFSALVRKNGRLQVSGHGQTQWADVKRASGITITPVTDTFAQWQVRLKAVDPRKFGDRNVVTASPGADATLFHRGNYVAAPRVVVRGDLPGGYHLGVAGLAFHVTLPLAPGTSHTIDYDDGRLRVNGLVAHGFVGESYTPGIEPGVPAVVSLTPNGGGTGTAEFTVYDTYI